MEKEHEGNLLKDAEGSLLWDEYKYRHDLIWKHLIRSTVAVISLLTVQFLVEYKGNTFVILIAFLLAIGYTLFTYYVISQELVIFDRIKTKHRERQLKKLGIDHKNDSGRIGFPKRVKGYLISLIVISFFATIAYRYGYFVSNSPCK